MIDPHFIELLPENPHYFYFHSEPTLLITSAEHYGSVINLDFDYLLYLDALAAYGMNATRIYAGAYVEPEEYFIHDNPLGPPSGRLCLPWARSEVPGYPLGGNKFNLDQWDTAYFARLKDFIAQAAQRRIVVEICFFNAMYPDTWASMPLYHANNLQGVGRGECKDFQTLKDAVLLARQEAYVRKITQEVCDLGNVILEIVDEPGLHGTPPEEYTAWIERLIDVIVETEKDLPCKHLIAQQVCGTLGGVGDFASDPRVSVVVGQYIGETGGAQFGGMQLLDVDYKWEKPIELNETAYYPIWYEGDILAASRVEAWEFIVGGGASFNHLNGLFSTYNPAALGTGNEAVLGQLRCLREFMQSFDFVRVQRDPHFFAGLSVGNGLFARGLSESGRQYALYMHHSTNKDVKYVVNPGQYQDHLELDIPAGDYRLEWIEPASGQVLESQVLHHKDMRMLVATPVYAVDIALRLLAMG